MLTSVNNRAYFLPRFWLSSFLLMVAASFGVFMSMFSSNMFLIWFGLEIKMFSMIPFINMSAEDEKERQLTKSNQVKVSFFYFFVQVLGSLLFAWGSVASDAFFLGLMGLMIKMGVVPFFWWVPPLISRLDWLSMGVMSTMQKMPGLFLFRLLFDMSFNMCIAMGLMGLMISAMGINLSYKNFKQLMAWSSMSNMSMLFVLVVINSSLGLIYYMFYSLMILMFCCILAYSDKKEMSHSFTQGNTTMMDMLVGSLLLMFSGLPPFMSFMLKVYFLSGIYSLDSVFVLNDLELKSSKMTFFYSLSKSLSSWNLAIMFLFLMVLQSVGYMKAFINMYSSKESRLLNSCKGPWTFLSCFTSMSLLMYLFSVFTMLF